VTDRVTPVWAFATAGGVVRLLIDVDRVIAPSLHAELAGCAIVADSLDEFMQMAHRAAAHVHAIIGELMKGPFPVRSVRESLLVAMRMPTTMEAAEATLRAMKAANPEEAKSPFEEPGWATELAFIRDLVRSLDEYSDEFLRRLSESTETPVKRIVSVLDLSRPADNQTT
jgi:hypothetical protein